MSQDSGKVFFLVISSTLSIHKQLIKLVRKVREKINRYKCRLGYHLVACANKRGPNTLQEVEKKKRKIMLLLAKLYYKR